MQQLLLFHKGIDSLDDNEYQQCLQSFGRELVTNIMFKGFLEELNKKKQNQHLSKINSIISAIRLQRETDNINQHDIEEEQEQDLDIKLNNDNNNDDKKSEALKVDKLPNVMLSEISSFLEFRDQLAFEKSNRTIFIGSRSSPIPMHELKGYDFVKLCDFANKNIETYAYRLRLFKSLTITTSNLTKSTFSGGRLKRKWIDFELFKHIEELKIITPGYGQLDIILTPLQRCIGLSHLKTVRFIGNESFLYSKYSAPSFFNRMQLEYFEYTAPFRKNEVYSNYEWVAGLKGIAITNVNDDGDENNMMRDICIAMGDNLESLHKGHSIMTHHVEGKLGKLKEICLPWNPLKLEIAMLIKENMTNLQRIHFRDNLGNTSNCNQFEKELMTLWMNKIMSTIEYIAFDAKDMTEHNILNILDVLIKSVEIKKKNRLKIRINGLDLTVPDRVDVIGSKLEQLMNILNINCSNWRLICYHLQCLEGDDMMNNLCESWKKRYGVAVSKESENTTNYVINNKGCNINGCHEKWQMKCYQCEQVPIFDI